MKCNSVKKKKKKKERKTKRIIKSKIPENVFYSLKYLILMRNYMVI